MSATKASFSPGHPSKPSCCASRTSVAGGTPARSAMLRIDATTTSFG